MTPVVELLRLLTLVPMAYGAWTHQPLYIGLGIVLLLGARASGFWLIRGCELLAFLLLNIAIYGHTLPP